MVPSYIHVTFFLASNICSRLLSFLETLRGMADRGKPVNLANVFRINGAEPRKDKPESGLYGANYSDDVGNQRMVKLVGDLLETTDMKVPRPCPSAEALPSADAPPSTDTPPSADAPP